MLLHLYLSRVTVTGIVNYPINTGFKYLSWMDEDGNAFQFPGGRQRYSVGQYEQQWP